MSKFNKQRKPSIRINLAGGESYAPSAKLELASLVLTSFASDQYYRSGTDAVEQLRGLLDRVDPLFAAKTAIYGRNEFGMRSISHLVAAWIGARVKGEQWTKNFFDKVVRRPDDVTEILSLSLQNDSTLPNSMKKGLGMALSRFNEYKLAKYKMEGKDVTLIDAVNLCHPAATKALSKLINGELKPAETWETKISATKGDDELKSSAWKQLIADGKLGYMAILRNLRNILQSSPESVPTLCAQIVDHEAIKKSLVLPFRFISALDALESEDLPTSQLRQVLVALTQAMDLSLSNVAKFDGETLVVIDTSGSMDGQPIKNAAIFGASLFKANNADLMIFSDDARYLNVSPVDSTFSIANAIMSKSFMGGTNFNAPFETANKAYDRIVILSDMQGWVGYNSPVHSFNQYKRRTGSSPKVYSIDLTGYGTLEMPESNIYCMAGFSEKIFDVIKLLEQDKNALVHSIEAVEL